MLKNYSKQEIQSEIQILKNTFPIVRLINPFLNKKLNFSDTKKATNHIENSCCYDFLKRKSRCSNCISALSIQEQKSYSKFEFIENSWWFCLARFVIVEGEDYALEILYQLKDHQTDTLLKESVDPKRIEELNRLVMLDELTGIYNRRYFNKKTAEIFKNNPTHQELAIALIDIDRLKNINDSFGHRFGDIAICTIADLLRKNRSEERRVGKEC